MRPPGRRVAAFAIVMAMLFTSCRSGNRVVEDDVAQVSASTTTSITTPEPTTTTSTSTSTSTTSTTRGPTTTAAPLPGLGPGSRGPEVLALEQRLEALRYDPGKVDDVFDGVTAYAVTAFQKVAGMDRTGRATDDVRAALGTAGPPQALVPSGGPTRVEVFMPGQFLVLYENGQLSKILPVSTGNGKRFCSEGWCRRAITPTGGFYVHRKARGWEKSPLGRLYNSVYIVDGIAIHGSASVPPYPASHGCIRIPMNAAEWFPGRVPMGTPVYVIGSTSDIPAPIPSTTSTLPTLPPVTAPPVTDPPVTQPPVTIEPPTTTPLLPFLTPTSSVP